jgi:hypothetical protein
MKLRHNSSRLSRVLFAFLAAITALFGRALHAQDPSPLLPPSPKLEAPIPKTNDRSRFALDRASVALGLLQGGAELFDGIGTHRYVHAPLCRSCTEGDPLCRLFLGPRPTWPRMLTLGTMEDLGAAYLHQSMRRSPHKLVRWLAPVAPLTLSALHIDEGLSVFSASTNPCSAVGPGYTVVSRIGDGVTCGRPKPSPPAPAPPFNTLGKPPRPR